MSISINAEQVFEKIQYLLMIKRNFQQTRKKIFNQIKGIYKNPMVLLGWPKSQFSFFRKIKDTFFIFTNNLIDLDILRMSAVSCYWLLVGRGQGILLNILQSIRQPHSKEIFGQNVNSTKKLRKPLLTYLISHSTFSIYGTNLFFAFQLPFYLS